MVSMHTSPLAVPGVGDAGGLNVYVYEVARRPKGRELAPPPPQCCRATGSRRSRGRPYGDSIRECSTERAPWYAVPANHKWYRDLVVARAIRQTLEEMDPQFPPPEDGLDAITIPG